MKALTYIHRSRLDASASVVFAWHENAGTLDRLIPPWENVSVIQRPGSLRDGERAVIRLNLGPLHRDWIAEHYDYVSGRQFCDRQVSGPFSRWEHVHQIEPCGRDACYLEDRISFVPPLGVVGSTFCRRFIQRKLQRMFAYRHRVTRDDIMTHQQANGTETLRIAVTGASGFVGSQLVAMLRGGGHTVLRLVRSPSKAEEADAILWQPDEGTIDTKRLENVDVVINLAGENLVAGRWSDAKRRAIRDSRVKGTTLLSEAMASLDRKPRAFLCASAVGYYGDRGDAILDEQSQPGEGFLASVCEAWEAAADAAREASIRTVHLRLGMVLSPRGGALGQMLLPFKLGVGGVIGSGRQYWSWIAIDDVLGSVHHLIHNDTSDGPVNLVSPRPVTNREFTKTLGRVLSRPTILPLPGFAARIALGDAADEMVLSSARVQPKRLLNSGYNFRYPDLEAALRHLLGKAV